jgi:5-methylcytosine-specific restriction endonuclease McrA
MKTIQPLDTIPDDELLRGLAELLGDSRRTEADLVAHVGEVDARRLYAREASPSMYAYCTERLHLSEAEAYLRIAAGRACREHPVLLAMLADGRLHLTAIAKLAPHLTAGNREALLEQATHRTKREIEELLAAVAPRPDAPALIRKLPERRAGAAAGPSASQGPALPVVAARPPGSDPVARPASELGLHEDPAALAPRGHGALPHERELRPDAVPLDGSGGLATSNLERSADALPGHPAAGHARAAVFEPLSPARYKVQFTATAELRDKLERLQALMRSSVPDGDLAAIIDAAVSEKLERLEGRRFGRTKAPRTTVGASHTAPASRHVPAAVRRAVYQRDEGRCRYVDEKGRRCTARAGLEFHHRHPFGLGGDHSPTNVALLCARHNRHVAEIDYGPGVGRHLRSSPPRQPSLQT